MSMLLGLYIIVVVMIGVVGSMITFSEAENEKNIFTFTFYLQRETFKSFKNELNIVGIIIILTIETIFLLPLNVVLLLIKSCMYLTQSFWFLFKKVFRKRNEEKETGE